MSKADRNRRAGYLFVSDYYSTRMAEQAIVGFHQDEHGDWVAELACGHGQHVRHRPPWELRPWVASEAGRQAHLGKQLRCLRCDEETEEG